MATARCILPVSTGHSNERNLFFFLGSSGPKKLCFFRASVKQRNSLFFGLLVKTRNFVFGRFTLCEEFFLFSVINEDLARSYDRNFISYLLTKRPEISSVNIWGETPISLAAEKGIELESMTPLEPPYLLRTLFFFLFTRQSRFCYFSFLSVYFLFFFVPSFSFQPANLLFLLFSEGAFSFYPN